MGGAGDQAEEEVGAAPLPAPSEARALPLTPCSPQLQALSATTCHLGRNGYPGLRLLAARLLGSLSQNSLWSTDCSLSSSSLVPGESPVSLPESFPFLLILGKEEASGR